MDDDEDDDDEELVDCGIAGVPPVRTTPIDGADLPAAPPCTFLDAEEGPSVAPIDCTVPASEFERCAVAMLAIYSTPN